MHKLALFRNKTEKGMTLLHVSRSLRHIHGFVDYCHNFVAIGNEFMDMGIRHRPKATCTHVI